ncbi:esterase/lipase-like protein [Paenibacillus curdlanolyticus YK9]|uniref:Esterase/lipase-like protein n=1 Tax=Paenibacillus curdlanolyticus YK9 TaxID=717606 RepID=E0I2Y3_9BACL|nr:alpha/beta hydrolase [Paenibacillus curdlanolyticus]EFM12647.1 esterase/lipase-like protein [Paenibacillus curdlanolyticus YK9]
MNANIYLWPEGAPYAAGEQEQDRPHLIPYLLHSEKSVSAVIVCPGGGYEFLADHEGGPIAQWLNENGIAAFVLKYRVAPYKHPVPLMDVQRAIRLVRLRAAEWNIDASHIGILGFSAGGHLASTAATHFDDGQAEAADPAERLSCRPDVAVVCYPVISMGEFRHNGSRENLLGHNPTEAEIALLSNELQVTPSTPPAFIWHTMEDDIVPVENALLFASALRRNGVPFELHVYEREGHGMGLAEWEPSARTWPNLCAEWLRKQGF